MFENESDKIWRMWPNESSAAFHAFKIYKKLGPRRSVEKVYQYFQKKGEVRYSRKQLNKWRGEFKWTKRVKAWDMYKDQIEEEEFIEETRKMARRHAKVARTMQSKIIQRLKKVDPDELTLNQLIHWFEVTTKIERLSADKPTEFIRATYKNKYPPINLDKLSDEQLEKLEQILSEVSKTEDEISGIKVE